MKLAISNIAWTAAEDEAAYARMRTHGVTGLEVAPTRVWPEWNGITPDALRRFRSEVEDAGLAISSLQALLFGKPELRLFGTAHEREGLADHLRWCADIASGLGAASLVFGAPRNRRRESLPEDTAFRMATDLFAAVSGHYADRGVVLAFEANPQEYGCDFATTTPEAAALVRAVDSPGFRLHLDVACAQLAGENVAEAIAAHRDLLQHFHVSEPYLADFEKWGRSTFYDFRKKVSVPIYHEAAACALTVQAYAGWVALEMRLSEPALDAVENALRFLTTTYGAAR